MSSSPRVPRRRLRGRSGFTLVELIVVMVIAALVAGFGGYGLSVAMRGYVVAKANAQLAQKVQVALMRMVNEFSIVDTCCQPTAAASSITYRPTSDGTNHTIALTGTTLTYDGQTLCDNVTAFTPAYNNGTLIISVVMTVRAGAAPNYTSKTYTLNVKTPG